MFKRKSALEVQLKAINDAFYELKVKLNAEHRRVFDAAYERGTESGMDKIYVEVRVPDIADDLMKP